MAVVAIVVTVFTAGVLAGPAAIALEGGIMAAGTAAMTSSLGIAMVAGALGSIASQAVGMALGIQDAFSWSGVAMGAIGAGFGASGLGAEISGVFGGGIPGAMAAAAASSVITQGIGVLIGAQKEFSWVGVAASAIGAGVSQAVGRLDFGGNTFARDLTAGLASGAARQVVSGGKANWANVAADAFGNALGYSIVEQSGGGSGGSQQVAELSNAERSASTRFDDDIYAAFGSARNLLDGERYELAGGPGARGVLPRMVIEAQRGNPGGGERVYFEQDAFAYETKAMDGTESFLSSPTLRGLNEVGGEIWSSGAETFPVASVEIEARALLPMASSGGSEMRPISELEWFWDHNSGVKFAKGVAGVIPGTIGAIKEIGLGAYDAIGASTYSALNYLAGSNVAYEPTGAIGASVQQRGWLPTIGDGVHGVVTNLPGVGLIGGVMHNDPEAMGSGIVGLAPLGMMRSAGRVGEVATNSAETIAGGINPRLTQRLDAWRAYQENGGQKSLQSWVQSTQKVIRGQTTIVSSDRAQPSKKPVLLAFQGDAVNGWVFRTVVSKQLCMFRPSAFPDKCSAEPLQLVSCLGRHRVVAD